MDNLQVKEIREEIEGKATLNILSTGFSMWREEF